jgi:hypothetical protein
MKECEDQGQGEAMQDWATQTVQIAVHGLGSPEQVRAPAESVPSIAGVEEVAVESDSLTVRHDPQVVTVASLGREMGRLGYGVGEKAEGTTPVSKLPARMPKADEEAFGNQTPDCCNLDCRQRR